MEGVINAYEGTLGEEGVVSPISDQTIVDIPKQVKTATTLLYVMSGLSLLDVMAGDPGGVFQIGFNLFLAHHVKQLKSWARTWILIRAGLGMIVSCFTVFSFTNTSQFPIMLGVLLINLSFSIATITLLTKDEVKSVFN